MKKWSMPCWHKPPCVHIFKHERNSPRYNIKIHTISKNSMPSSIILFRETGSNLPIEALDNISYSTIWGWDTFGMGLVVGVRVGVCLRKNRLKIVVGDFESNFSKKIIGG